MSARALPVLKGSQVCARLLDPVQNYELGLPERLRAPGLAAGVETHCAAGGLDGFSLDLGRTLVICTNGESTTALAQLAALRRAPHAQE